MLFSRFPAFFCIYSPITKQLTSRPREILMNFLDVCWGCQINQIIKRVDKLSIKLSRELAVLKSQ